MGQSKSGGYVKKEAVSPEQNTFVNQLLQQALPNLQSAAQGFQQFLPGGGGGQAIANQAQQRFQQQTVPSILNAFGSGAKGSSALNQALAAGAGNLNTDIASLLAQMQLQASQGLGNLAGQQSTLGTQTPLFAYLQQQPNRLQGALKGGFAGAGPGAAIGTAVAPGIGTAIGAGAGALTGALGGLF